jgi:hypothetical protein
MKIDMPTERIPASAGMAESMLRAWIRGDSAALLTEAGRTLAFSAPLLDSAEEERMHLLSAVARCIQTRPDPLQSSSDDPGIQVCVNLLLHLAASGVRPD